MKPITATLLATALAAAFSTAAYAQDAKPDNGTYRTMTKKAAADYKVAAAKCTGMAGNERAVCVEEAKVARANADLDAVAEYNNTTKARATARTALVNAQHALERVKCAVQTGTEKDNCIANAKSVHTAALADVKADRDIRVATSATAGVDGTGLVANTRSTEPAKAAAVDKCAQIAGQPSTGCLIDNKDTSVAATAGAAAANTRNAAANVAEKTGNMAENAVEKTKQVASTIADKTERAVDRVANRTERTTDVAANKAERLGDKTERVAENAAATTSKVVSDSVITTKVKADLFKEPELSAMAIHVETEKGVVMLSGFVDSKADAEKAVRLAKSVEGVTQVKSAIKVK